MKTPPQHRSAGRPTRVAFWPCVALIVGACLWLGLWLGPFLSAETLYWYFSTVAQAVVAVLAFVGLMALFRLEEWRRECERLNLLAAKVLARGWGEDAHRHTPEETVEKWKKEFAGRAPDARPARKEVARMELLLRCGKSLGLWLRVLVLFCLPTAAASLASLLLVPLLERSPMGGLFVGATTAAVAGLLLSAAWLFHQSWKVAPGCDLPDEAG